MTNQTKLIFLDIDGTLTKPGTNDIPPSALSAVKQARRAGHRVFLCTGRNYDMLSPLLKYGFDGVIGSSGAYIEAEGKVLCNCPFSPKDTEKAMEVLAAQGIFRTVECRDGAFTDEGLKDFLREHAAEGSNSELLRWREQIESSLHIRPMSDYYGQPIYKIILMALSRDSLLQAAEELEGRFHCVLQEPSAQTIFNGELIGKDFDKGQAISTVCAHFGCSTEDTCGFGDSMNDLEMLQTVGTAVCMENGSEGLKPYADLICPAWFSDGILKAFAQLGLLDEGTQKEQL